MKLSGLFGKKKQKESDLVSVQKDKSKSDKSHVSKQGSAKKPKSSKTPSKDKNKQPKKA